MKKTESPEEGRSLREVEQLPRTFRVSDMFVDLSVPGTFGDLIPVKEAAASFTYGPTPGACLWLMVTAAWMASADPWAASAHLSGGSFSRSALSGRSPGARQEGLWTPPEAWSASPAPPTLGWPRPGYLNGPQLHLRGAALHIAVVAAAGAALHLHAGRPHQEVGVGAVYEAPRDLEHLGACLALGDHGWLSDCRGTWREQGPPSGWWACPEAPPTGKLSAEPLWDCSPSETLACPISFNPSVEGYQPRDLGRLLTGLRPQFPHVQNGDDQGLPWWRSG